MALTKRTLSLKVGAASKTRPVKEGLHGLFFFKEEIEMPTLRKHWEMPGNMPQQKSKE